MEKKNFEKTIQEICGDDVKSQYEYLKKFNKNILEQNEETRWKRFTPNHTNPQDGYHLVICCGISGIYQTYNIWDSEKKDWLIKSADGSSVIMYKDIEPYLD